MNENRLKKLNLAVAISALLCVAVTAALLAVSIAKAGPMTSSPEQDADEHLSQGLGYVFMLVFLFVPATVGAGISGAVTAVLGICILAKCRSGFAKKGVYVSAAVFEFLTAGALLLGSAPLIPFVATYAVNCVSAVILIAAATVTCVFAAKYKKKPSAELTPSV